MDPIIQEMAQAKYPIRPEVFFRWVHHLTHVVQPQLDRMSETEEAQPVTSYKRKVSA